MASKFRICIIRADGTEVHFHPGSHEELDFVSAVVDRTLEKGVGFFRTKAHVAQDLTAAIEEVINDLKAEVRAL